MSILYHCFMDIRHKYWPAENCKDCSEIVNTVMVQSWKWRKENKPFVEVPNGWGGYRKTAVVTKPYTSAQRYLAWHMDIRRGVLWCIFHFNQKHLWCITGPTTQLASGACSNNSAQNRTKKSAVFTHFLLHAQFRFCQISLQIDSETCQVCWSVA